MLLSVDVFNTKTKAYIGSVVVHHTASEAQISDEVFRMIQNSSVSCSDFVWETVTSQWDG